MFSDSLISDPHLLQAAQHKNGAGFGLGLGTLLLIAAVPWLDVGLNAVPYFLESLRWISHITLLGFQLGVSGLVAGWLAYELSRPIADDIARAATMTLVGTACAAVLSIVYSLLAWPFSFHVLAFYSFVLPIPCFVIVPLWAGVYPRLALRFDNAGSSERDISPAPPRPPSRYRRS